MFTEKSPAKPAIKNRATVFSLAVIALLLSTSCSQEPDVIQTKSEQKLTIYTSIAPHHYACRQLLGEVDEIINICPADEDAANYMPERFVLNLMLQSDLIILNGASFEQWTSHVGLPHSKLLDASKTFQSEWINYESKTHSHGDDEHSHRGVNGHTWLAPTYFKKQCEAIYIQLQHLLSPAEQEQRSLSENHTRLQEKLTQLDTRAREVFAPLKNSTIAATHPTYDYLAQDYDFTVFNITLDPDATELDATTAQELLRLKKHAEQSDITYLLWESQPSKLLASAVEALGLQNVLFMPLESMDHLDYTAGMNANLDQIEQLIRTQRGAN